jgi:hypothetical protein
MIDLHKELVSALSSILPTEYEMKLTSKTKTPCLSYMELSNVAVNNSTFDSMEYSRVRYQIKVWATDIAVIQRYALEVDAALRPLGFKRVNSTEISDNNSAMIQKVLTYECLALEEF